MIGPVFEELSNKYPAVTFLKVDVDEVQEVAQACGVRAMPTFQSWLNGAKVGEVVGADPKKLEALIQEVASKVVAGAGVKLGGAGVSAAAPTDDSPEARRARMLAAAEARMAGSG